MGSPQDQRFSDDGATRYLIMHYGCGFRIEPPENPGDGWTAKSLSGNDRLIEAGTAGELESKLRLILG
jgi:hypothetical protein